MTPLNNTNQIVTRFAPSPTGRLHIGHAYSALFAYTEALQLNGRFILRIEDIDTGRCKPKFEASIYEDLRWLGLTWEEPVRRQSEHMEDYQHAIDILKRKNLLYPCFCTRKSIQKEITRAGSAPHGPEGILYPGICRNLSRDEQEERKASCASYALRLNMDKALNTLDKPLFWTDTIKGVQKATPELLGDPVLARKDVTASYHLCVTLDDHLQGVTCVTRGEDLFYASHLHRLLQHLLDLNVPVWHHHPLILDREGKRFAKRNHGITLKFLREKEGKTPADIMSMIGLRLP